MMFIWWYLWSLIEGNWAVPAALIRTEVLSCTPTIPQAPSSNVGYLSALKRVHIS